MSILSQIKTKSLKVKAVIAVVLALAFLVPGFVLSSHRNNIYVNDDATGSQDGSASHPYKTIRQAMKAASKHSEIHISKGTYQENVDVKEGVEIYGESEDGVIIKADDKDDAVVKMSDDTVLNKVTVENGRYGIQVRDDAKASISNCTIKENKRNGIFIERDGVKRSNMVSISESEIRDNDGTGIYSEKRRLSITDNEIRNNDGDGIDIEKGSTAWIADNKISSNDKSGMKLRIDGSTIWTKSNSIRNNDREGIEVTYNGTAGRINIAKTKIIGNRKFGVARIQRVPGAPSAAIWNRYLTFDVRNTINSNNSGDISPVFVIN